MTHREQERNRAKKEKERILSATEGDGLCTMTQSKSMTPDSEAIVLHEEAQ